MSKILKELEYLHANKQERSYSPYLFPNLLKIVIDFADKGVQKGFIADKRRLENIYANCPISTLGFQMDYPGITDINGYCRDKFANYREPFNKQIKAEPIKSK